MHASEWIHGRLSVHEQHVREMNGQPSHLRTSLVLLLCHSVSAGEGTRGTVCKSLGVMKAMSVCSTTRMHGWVCVCVCVCVWVWVWVSAYSRLQSQSARGRRRQGLRAAWPSLTLCRARQCGREVLSLQGSRRLQTQHSQSPRGPRPPRAWLCSCGSRGLAWFTCARVCLSRSAKCA
jgi:hypothetical protein